MLQAHQLLHLKKLATKNKPQRELIERKPIELNLHKFSWAQHVDQEFSHIFLVHCSQLFNQISPSNIFPLLSFKRKLEQPLSFVDKQQYMQKRNHSMRQRVPLKSFSNMEISSQRVENKFCQRIGNSNLICQIMHKAINKFEQAKTQQ